MATEEYDNEKRMRNGEEGEMSGRKSGVNRNANFSCGIDAVNQLGFYIHLELIFMSMVFAQPTLVDGVFEM